MSISHAMQSGVSGLLANSKAVSRISYNIANADTNGFRRSFAHMVTGAGGVPSKSIEASGVRAAIHHDNDVDGTVLSTDRATNLAISGPGFFAVTHKINGDGGETRHLLTRAGDFEPDANGNLRNAGGYFLAGFPYDETGELGLVDRDQFTGLRTVNIADSAIAGNPTTEMSIQGNLPSQESGVVTPGDPFISSIEYYTPLGEAERLQFSWQPSATSNEWDLTVTDTAGNTYGDVTIEFNDSGSMAGSPSAYSNIVNNALAPAAFSFDAMTGIATVTVDNGTTPQVIEVSLGTPNTFEGLTQFSGDYVPLIGNANGTQSGALVRAEIDDKGDVWGVFDNGARKPLYNVPLALVPNPNGLMTADNAAFVVSNESGRVQLGTANTGSAGSITASAVETSNVDIAEELTELIQKQRAYSSNAKIITTADEMLDETVRLKR